MLLEKDKFIFLSMIKFMLLIKNKFIILFKKKTKLLSNKKILLLIEIGKNMLWPKDKMIDNFLLQFLKSQLLYRNIFIIFLVRDKKIYKTSRPLEKKIIFSHT